MPAPTLNVWLACRDLVVARLGPLNLPGLLPGSILPVFSQIWTDGNELALDYPCLLVSLDADPKPSPPQAVALGVVEKTYPVTVTVQVRDQGRTDDLAAFYTATVAAVEQAFRNTRPGVRGVWQVLAEPLDLKLVREKYALARAGVVLRFFAREPVTGIPA